jgi:hypothetical protein
LQFDEENPSQKSINDGQKRLQKARADVEHKILNSRSYNLADYHSYQLDAQVDIKFFVKGLNGSFSYNERQNFI